MKGKKHSTETKLKISASHKALCAAHPEVKNYLRGRVVTTETRAKISASEKRTKQMNKVKYQ